MGSAPGEVQWMMSGFHPLPKHTTAQREGSAGASGPPGSWQQQTYTLATAAGDWLGATSGANAHVRFLHLLPCNPQNQERTRTHTNRCSMLACWALCHAGFTT